MAESGLLTKPMPLEFNGNISEKWKIWKKEFEIYIEAIEMTNKPATTKRAIFLNLIGKEGRQIAENFSFTFAQDEEQTVTMELMMQKFESYCNPRKNTMYTRYKLWNMNKSEDETIDQFTTRLQIVAKDGGYGDQEENMVRDRIVFGIKDDSLRERILEKDDIPLQRVLAMVRSHEITRQQMKTIKKPDMEMFQIQQTYRNNKQRKDKPKECDYCGLRHERRACPAYGKACNNCQKLNHFASVCRLRKSHSQEYNVKSYHDKTRKKIHEILNETANDGSDTTDEEVYITTIQSIGSLGAEWYQEAKLDNTIVNFKLDSGAQANVIPTQIYDKLKTKPRIKQTNIKLKVYGGKIIEPIGKIDMKTTILGHTHTIPYIIAEVKSGPVLGLDTCKQFSLIKRDQPELKSTERTKQNKYEFTSEEQMKQQFKEVFQGIGCYKDKIQLHIKENALPIIHPPRKIPVSLQERLKTTLENLENDKIIEKVEYPTNWVNSLVIKEKKDGKLRVCIDPRDLNKVLLREHYRIPTAEEIYTKLQGKKYFTVLDQKCGYWNIKLDNPSADLCTFNTPTGKYRFKRLPFGLSVAPEIFQRKNDKEFGDLPGIGISTDDFIIGGTTREECLDNVRKVLERAKINNTRFNKDKIQFCKQQVKYLGRLISADGISMDPEKVQAITDLQAPKTKTEVRSLLGLVTYLMPFIPDLPSLTVSLREIIKQKNEFYWTAHHDECLAKLKKAIINATHLKHFNPNKQITIQADASQYGLGACLMQEGYPIAYTSRALQSHETRYAQIEKEFLAITNACEKFHYYIYGYKTVIQTDHKPLLAIMEKPLDKITNRLQRFVLRLQRYNIQLMYKPGKELVIADLLSRNFNKKQQQLKTTQMETIHNIETPIHTPQLSGH